MHMHTHCNCYIAFSHPLACQCDRGLGPLIINHCSEFLITGYYIEGHVISMAIPIPFSPEAYSYTSDLLALERMSVSARGNICCNAHL